MILLLDERRFTPSRRVEIEHDGHWWPGFQFAWRLGDDDRGCVAHVEFSARHEWGLGKHLAC